MLPLHTPLDSISENQLYGGHLSPYIYGKIAGKASEGHNSYQIATNLDLKYSTVQYIIQQDELYNKEKFLL